VDIGGVWKSIGKNMKASATERLGYYELKQHKPWLAEEYPKLLGEMKEVKLQWLQNPIQIHRVSMNSVRCETCQTFWNRKMEYLKKNINEIETDNNNNKNIRELYRGINEL